MTESTLVVFSAAIGATGALLGALVGAYFQHRFNLRERRILAQEERKSEQEAQRRREEEEAAALRRLLTDLRETSWRRDDMQRIFREYSFYSDTTSLPVLRDIFQLLLTTEITSFPAHLYAQLDEAHRAIARLEQEVHALSNPNVASGR